MRVGVIRGDLPGSVKAQDLETVSQFVPTTEPLGQERRIGRPDPTNVATFLGTLPAAIQSSGAVSFPLTTTNGNHTLRVQLVSAGPFTAVVIPNATYNTMALLLAAVNAALVSATVAANATTDSTGTLFVLQSNAKGVSSYIGVDSVGNGSTFNTPTNLGAGASNFTVPSATTVITALLPVGGPLNVSAAQILTTLGASPLAANVADLIAPKFIETDVAIKSFQVGNLSKFRASTYTPDPFRLPALAQGAAISVVQDDGVSLFTAALTAISGAVHNSPNTGDITITGTNLGVTEQDLTAVRVTNPTTGVFVKLFQKVIRRTLTGGTQGSVAPTSIVIPASLLNGLGVVGSTVQVHYTSFASNVFTVT